MKINKLIFIIIWSFSSLLAMDNQQENSEKDNLYNELQNAIKKENNEKAIELINSGMDLNYNGPKTYLNPHLCEACHRRNYEIAKLLIEKKVDLNATNSGETTALMRACVTGMYDIVKLLIDSDANVNAQNCVGHSALTEAITWGHAKIVKLLIDSGADLSLKDRDGNYMISLAARAKFEDSFDFDIKWGRRQPDEKNDYEKIVYYLLEANKNLIKEDLNCALIFACQKNKINLIKNLIKSGADINGKDTNQNMWNSNKSLTPLIVACQYNNYYLVKFLLNLGADPNIVDERGNSALIYALKMKNCEINIVKALIEAGADVNIQSVYTKDTPLIEAVKNGNLEIVEYIVKNGADILKINDYYKNNSIDLAFNYHHNSIVKYLIEVVKNKVNIQEYFKNLFSKIIENNNIELFNYFITLGFDVNQDYKDNSLLYLAAYNFNHEIVKLLLNSGVNMEKNKNIISKLLASDGFVSKACVDKEKFEVIKLLVDAGADLSSRDENGNTPFLKAIKYDTHLIDIVKLFLNKNIDLFVKDNDNISALKYKHLDNDIKKLILKAISKKIFEAIQKTDYSKIKDLATKSNFQIKDEFENNPLHLAVLLPENNQEEIEKKFEIIKLLLIVQKNLITQKNNKNLTPIELALSTGNIKTVKLFTEFAYLNSLKRKFSDLKI